MTADEESVSWLRALIVDWESQRAELLESLREILEYRGGAESALEDEYVMDRARAAVEAADCDPSATLECLIACKRLADDLGLQAKAKAIEERGQVAAPEPESRHDIPF